VFKKFKILNHNEAHQIEEQIEMLINVDHIISIKPIKMTNSKRDVIDGFWIRLSNNKKYKALSIPDSIAESFKEDLQAPVINDYENEVSLH